MNTPKPQCFDSNNKTVTTHRVHLDVIMCVSLYMYTHFLEYSKKLNNFLCYLAYLETRNHPYQFNLEKCWFETH